MVTIELRIKVEMEHIPVLAKTLNHDDNIVFFRFEKNALERQVLKLLSSKLLISTGYTHSSLIF